MRFSPYISLISILVFSSGVLASEQNRDSEIFAQRGKGIVTQSTIFARANKIPADSRNSALRDRKRLQDVINALLLRAQLVADAREVDFDKQQIVIDRMQLGAESELAEAWLEHYIDSKPKADIEQLAREYYELNKTNMKSQASIDVSHILISNEERGDEEAKKMADSVYKMIKSDPASFDDLIMSKSEDPSSASNKGKFFNVKKGDMVKEFEVAAFALKGGEISEPVKTAYGYHIIRLDAHNAPKQLSFDDVKDSIMASQKENHRDRIKRDYLGSLTSLNVEMTEEALKEMVRRVFGEDYLDSATGNNE